MPLRIYHVQTSSGDNYLVEAINRQAALAHAAKYTMTVTLPKQQDLVNLSLQGLVVETAGKADKL